MMTFQMTHQNIDSGTESIQKRPLSCMHCISMSSIVLWLDSMSVRMHILKMSRYFTNHSRTLLRNQNRLECFVLLWAGYGTNSHHFFSSKYLLTQTWHSYFANDACKSANFSVSNVSLKTYSLSHFPKTLSSKNFSKQKKILSNTQLNIEQKN